MAYNSDDPQSVIWAIVPVFFFIIIISLVIYSSVQRNKLIRSAINHGQTRLASDLMRPAPVYNMYQQPYQSFQPFNSPFSMGY